MFKVKITRNALTDLRDRKIEPTGLGKVLDVDDKREVKFIPVFLICATG